MKKLAFTLLLSLGLSSFGQTSATLNINVNTGAIVGPVSASTFAIANGLTNGGGGGGSGGNFYNAVTTNYTNLTKISSTTDITRFNNFSQFLCTNGLTNLLYDAFLFYPNYQNLSNNTLYSLFGRAGTNVGGQWFPWGLNVSGNSNSFVIFSNLANLTYSNTVFANLQGTSLYNTNTGQHSIPWSLNSPTGTNFECMDYNWSGMNSAFINSSNGAFVGIGGYFKDAVANLFPAASGMRHTFTVAYNGLSSAIEWQDSVAMSSQTNTYGVPLQPAGNPNFLIAGGSWINQSNQVTNVWNGTLHLIMILTNNVTQAQLNMLEQAARIIDPRPDNVVVYGDSQEAFRNYYYDVPSWSYYMLTNWNVSKYVYDFGMGGAVVQSQLAASNFLYYCLNVPQQEMHTKSDLYLGGGQNDIFANALTGLSTFIAETNIVSYAVTNGYVVHGFDHWLPDSNTVYAVNGGTYVTAANLVQMNIYNGLLQSNRSLFSSFISDRQLFPITSTNTSINPLFAQFFIDSVHLTPLGNQYRAASILGLNPWSPYIDVAGNYQFQLGIWSGTATNGEHFGGGSKSGLHSTSFGSNAVAYSTTGYDTAFGESATASGGFSTAIGRNVSAGSPEDVVLGVNSSSAAGNSGSSIDIGFGEVSAGTAIINIGGGTFNSYFDSITMGNSLSISNNYSMIFGWTSTNIGEYGVVFGLFNSNGFNNSIVFGTNNSSTANNQFNISGQDLVARTITGANIGLTGVTNVNLWGHTTNWGDALQTNTGNGAYVQFTSNGHFNMQDEWGAAYFSKTNGTFGTSNYLQSSYWVTTNGNMLWSGTATGNGSGITSLNASSLSIGTILLSLFPSTYGTGITNWVTSTFASINNGTVTGLTISGIITNNSASTTNSATTNYWANMTNYVGLTGSTNITSGGTNLVLTNGAVVYMNTTATNTSSAYGFTNVVSGITNSASSTGNTFLSTNITQRMWGNIYSNDLHMNGGTPTVAVNGTTANAVLNTTSSGVYVLPGSSDQATQCLWTNGSGGNSASTSGYLLGTNTFVNAYNSTNYVVTFQAFALPGQALTYYKYLSGNFFYATNQTTTGFQIAINGGPAGVATANSVFGLGWTVIPPKY